MLLKSLCQGWIGEIYILLVVLLCIIFEAFLTLQGWKMYANLLIDLFRFLAPFLRNAELTKPTQLLYKVTSVCLCVWYVWSFFGLDRIFTVIM